MMKTKGCCHHKEEFSFFACVVQSKIRISLVHYHRITIDQCITVTVVVLRLYT